MQTVHCTSQLVASVTICAEDSQHSDTFVTSDLWEHPRDSLPGLACMSCASLHLYNSFQEGASFTFFVVFHI